MHYLVIWFRLTRTSTGEGGESSSSSDNTESDSDHEEGDENEEGDREDHEGLPHNSCSETHRHEGLGNILEVFSILLLVIIITCFYFL